MKLKNKTIIIIVIILIICLIVGAVVYFVKNESYQIKPDDNYKFILIIGTGRSGTTLLQRIISTSIPKTNIYGENYGSIFNLLEYYYNLKRTKKKSIESKVYQTSYDKMISDNHKPAWYNNFNINIIKEHLKKIIIQMLYKKDSQIIGCKMIRFKDKLFLMDIFLELFPNTKIIYNHRENIDSHSKSSWWKDDKNAVSKIKELNKQLITYSNNKSSYMFSYEKIFKIDEMKKLFQFLEEDFNEDKYNKQIDKKM